MNSHLHLDAELLAAWSEGNLPKDEAARVDEHLADCSSCQEMLAVFARTEPPPVASGFPGLSGAERSRLRWRWQWAIPIAAAATVAAIWVAIPGDERSAQLNPTAAPPLAEPSTPSIATDAVSPVQAQRPESKSIPPQRTTPSGSVANLAKKETPAAKAEQFETRRTPEVSEPDQRLKDDTAQSAAAAAPAAPAVPAESRLEAVARQVSSEVVSPDPLVRWRIVAGGRLERTTDGGKAWAAVTLPDQVTATGVVVPTATTAIVTTADGRRFRTVDQGKTWSLVQP